MEEDELPKNIYDPYLFKKVGLGVNIALVDVDLQLNYEDLKELNEGVNKSGIFIHLEPEGGYGGLGEVFTKPEFIVTIPILLYDFTVDIFAGFAYDALKYAFKKIFEKIGKKKGNPNLLAYDIMHNNTTVIVIVHDGVIDEELLDLSLRKLLEQIVLKEVPFHDNKGNQESHGVG